MTTAHDLAAGVGEDHGDLVITANTEGPGYRIRGFAPDSVPVNTTARTLAVARRTVRAIETGCMAYLLARIAELEAKLARAEGGAA